MVRSRSTPCPTAPVRPAGAVRSRAVERAPDLAPTGPWNRPSAASGTQRTSPSSPPLSSTTSATTTPRPAGSLTPSPRAPRPLRRPPDPAHVPSAPFRLRAADNWPAERESALALLRADAAREGHHGGRPLIDALPDDEDTTAAWRAAPESGAHDDQWLTLANRSRTIRPTDALVVRPKPGSPGERDPGPYAHESGDPVHR